MTMGSSIIIIFAFCFVVGPLLTLARTVDNYEEDSEWDDDDQMFNWQIVPGTKWCGSGDKAANDSDLGRFNETDACCREHDKCPLSIGGRETKYGLTNPDRSTRSHCDCDQKFYQCLTKTSSRLSRSLKIIYFTFLRKKCFRKKQCPAGTTCKEEYEWVRATAWLQSEKNMKKLYDLLALLESELENDSSEDNLLE